MKRMLLLVLLAGWMVPVALAQHAEIGAYGDYLHLSQTDTNLAGVGGRLGVNVSPALQFEAQMSYDFEQAFTEGFTSSGIGQVGTARSNMQVLQALFGPKLQSRGPVKLFLTLKGGFAHFNLGPESGNFPGAISTIQNLRANNVDGMLYPGGGLEASLGPIGLRLDVGDDIYFANGAHHNFSVSFGPVIHF
jgi:hypothetical protein